MSEEEDQTTAPVTGGLRLKQQEEHVPSPLAEMEPPPSKKRKKKKKKKQSDSTNPHLAQEEVKTPGKKSKLRFFLISGLPFFFSLVIFSAFIAHQVLDWQILTHQQALFARNILITSLFVILIIEAFVEDILQGVLCLFVPPYSIMYGIFVADAGPIRGLTLAVLCFLGAEMYYTPDDALVPLLEEKVNGFIKTNQDRLLDPYRDDEEE